MMLSRFAVASLFLSVCLAARPVSAADETAENAEFARLKSTYAKELQKITDSNLQAIVGEQEKYIGAIRDVQKTKQQAGDLDGVLAIGKEIDRYSAARKIEKENISKDSPELAPLQSSYIQTMETYSIEQARKVLALVQNYERALVNLQETLTKNDDIRSAIEVKTEKEGLANRAEVMAARALVMDVDTKAEQEKSADTAAPEIQDAQEKAATKPKDKNRDPVKRKYAGTPEKRLRQRFDDFAKEIMKQDFSKALDFVDPAYVKATEAKEVRRSLMDAFLFLKLAYDSHRKLSIESLKITDKEDSATVTPRLWAAYQWNELSAHAWIETEGDWYLDISEVEKAGPSATAELIRLERAEQRKPWTRGMLRLLPGMR